MQFADQRLLNPSVGLRVVAVQALNRGVGDKPLEGLNAGIGGERELRNAGQILDDVAAGHIGGAVRAHLRPPLDPFSGPSRVQPTRVML